MNQHRGASTRLSRRTLAVGAAWTVPVIAASASAPAYALSQKQLAATVCKLYYGDGSDNWQVHSIFFGFESATGTVPSGSVFTYVITSDKPMNEPSHPTSSFFTQTSSLSADGKTLTVTISLTSNLTSPYCGSISVVWNDSIWLTPGTTLTIEGSVTAPSGHNSGGTSTLKYKVADRYASTNSGTFAHVFVSKLGNQLCYPTVSYASFNHSNSTSWPTCGDGGNDTSTKYPDGTCRMITGLASNAVDAIPSVC
ncbi:MAG TPA: hypothetical protein PKK40_02650 [Marmoricola sp.]|nr:hypothetical protein [Marmoricola sp.]